MSKTENWLLPEGVDEVLPPQAWRLECLRRRLMDMYRGWGYELVLPPFIEYLESLLTGTGNDMDLQTFKLTDQLSGRLMGVRADITPQAARIDAHRLKREEPTRLCYLGTVLHTRGDGFAGSRSPLQVGAELFGHGGAESDLEILGLMLDTLDMAGISDVHLDLGHVGIFRGLVRDAGLDAEQEAVLFDALQRKAVPELHEFVAGLSLPAAQGDQLVRLAELHGGDEVLDEARSLFQGAGNDVIAALDNLAVIAAAVRARRPGLPVYFDLAELRGYHYHTGVLFAAFVPGMGQEIARGGRYDGIGQVFGHARPATGFSTDLKTLMMVGNTVLEESGAIFAPASEDATQQTLVAELRHAGGRVINGLPGQSGGAKDMGCDRELVKDGDGWVVRPVV